MKAEFRTVAACGAVVVILFFAVLGDCLFTRIVAFLVAYFAFTCLLGKAMDSPDDWDVEVKR